MKKFKDTDISHLPEDLQEVLRCIVPEDALLEQIVVHKITPTDDGKDSCSAFDCDDCSNCPIDEAIENIDTRVAIHSEICSYLNGLYASKNADYGNAFGDTFKELGIVSAITRITDKTNRLKALCKPGSDQKVNDESIRDTLLDLANYAIMTVIKLDQEGSN
jgi:hypothetical protein